MGSVVVNSFRGLAFRKGGADLQGGICLDRAGCRPEDRLWGQTGPLPFVLTPVFYELLRGTSGLCSPLPFAWPGPRDLGPTTAGSSSETG